MATTAADEEYSMAVDFASGVVGGCSGIIVGQPFDTVKVRLQTHGAFYNGALDCVGKTFRNEGPRGFFKGMASPLFGSAWTNAIMFGVYERSLRLLDPQPSSPSLRSVFGAGVIGGFCQTVALTPAELIKCRLQVQDGHENARYKGPVDCARHIYARHGLRGLFFGYSVTLWREVPTYGFYFFSYEYAKRKMLAHGVNENTAMLTAGGIAGVGSWTLAYPADVLKSSIQTVSDAAPAIERTMAFQARRLYRLGGWRIFVHGLETAVVRAFPVNAVTFYCYEMASETLKAQSRRHRQEWQANRG